MDGDWIESGDISESGIRYVTTGSVGEGHFRDQGDGYITADTFSRLRCTEVLPGDVLVSRLNLPVGRACVVPAIADRYVTSVDNVIIRPDDWVCRRYLVYMLSCVEHFSNMENLARGTTMQRISRSALGAVRFAFPPHLEQRSIADFLDMEFAKVDALIEEQSRLIELLSEKRQALISRFVTTGLNSNVPMRDSGVAWMGKVPTHWRTSRNAAIFREIDDRHEGRDGELMTVSHLTGVSKRSEKSVNMILAESLEGYKRARAGDLVINTMWAWMGALGVSPCEGLFSPSYNVYRIRDPSLLLPSYFELMCRVPLHVTAMRAASKGIWESRLRLYPNEFLGMGICLPPVNEQQEICDRLEVEIRSMDELSREAERAAALLRERRAALISAAVTGKIDVRGLVPSEAA